MKPLQLNGTYYAEEDRIMLRIKSVDHSEYRFWLTRLISQKILHAIESLSIQNIASTNQSKALSQGVIEAIDDMQQKAVQNETDLTKPYQPATKLPLGSDPRLISGVSFITIGTSQINMQLTLKNHTPIELELNIATLAKIRLLLNELNKKARWELVEQENITQDTAALPPHSIH